MGGGWGTAVGGNDAMFGFGPGALDVGCDIMGLGLAGIGCI